MRRRTGLEKAFIGLVGVGLTATAGAAITGYGVLVAVCRWVEKTEL